MRDLLKQDRPLSPDAMRAATGLLGLLFGLASLVILVFGVANLFRIETFLIGILQICGGLGLILSLYLIVRLLSDGVMALRRMNDRIILQTEALAERVAPAPAKAVTKPRASKTSTRKTAARSKTATSPKPNETDQG